MKYFILISAILFSTNSNSLTNNECRYGVIKCGYKATNPRLFCSDMSAEQRSCVESYISEHSEMLSAKEARKNSKEQAMERIKNYDCNTLVGFMKDICLTYE